MTLSPPQSSPPNAAFSLIELLVVAAILGVLVGLLLPAIGRAQDRAAHSKCVGQLRSTYLAAQLYTVDHNGEVVPGSIKNQGESGTGVLWSARLVPYYSEQNNERSASFACPKWTEDAVSLTAYNWGYAMNVSPGYEGASSTAADRAVSVITNNDDGSTTGRIFRMAAITHPSRRLFFCDSSQWHVRGQQVKPGNPGQTLAGYDRHGKDRCNVVFFDGHIRTLSPQGVESALYDPANFFDPSLQ